jgi:hypothetical protein
MECLRAFLKENGFKIGTGIVTAVNTLSGDDASDIGIANYINSFREAISPASMKYTLALAGDAVVVAIDCDVSCVLERIDKYADARINADIPERFRISNVVAGSLEIISVSGDLRYRYNVRTHGIMGSQEYTKEVSVKEVGDSILEYARKTFPKAFLPPEGK